MLSPPLGQPTTVWITSPRHSTPLKLTKRKTHPKVGSLLGPEISNTLNAASVSRRAIQGCRQCTDNATKLLQDYCIQQISGRDPIPTERARLEGWRFAGTHPECFETEQTRGFLTPRFILQFTYINLAFSPAPDDTVSNLYKVWIAVLHRLIHVLMTDPASLSPQTVI